MTQIFSGVATGFPPPAAALVVVVLEPVVLRDAKPGELPESPGPALGGATGRPHVDPASGMEGELRVHRHPGQQQRAPPPARRGGHTGRHEQGRAPGSSPNHLNLHLHGDQQLRRGHPRGRHG